MNAQGSSYRRAWPCFGNSRSCGAPSGVAGELGQPARAAQLLGAAEAIHESIDRSLTPVQRAVFDQYTATIRAQLDDATFTAMWAEGQKMTLDQAKAKALG